jgi:hypothetical protein
MPYGGLKLTRRRGDFALVSVAVWLLLADDGVSQARVSVMPSSGEAVATLDVPGRNQVSATEGEQLGVLPTTQIEREAAEAWPAGLGDSWWARQARVIASPTY